IARLLQLDEREAVETLRCVFTAPPVDSPKGTFGVLLLVTLDGVDLLWAASNSLVALVAHQLCASLDELNETAPTSGCHVVVLATAESGEALPTALLSRLSLLRVHVAHTSVQERLCVIDRRSLATDFPPRVREMAAEALAGLTAGQLAAMGDEALLQLLEREAALDAQQQKQQHMCRQQQQRQQMLDGDKEKGEDEEGDMVDEAYRGLIGVRDVIRDLEELVVWPLLQLPFLRRCNVAPPKGLVLFGPPGSGKTAVLTALARRLR
ncbi:cell division cycle protein, partial [Trypanosoma grayi]|uniref:cell division cycle protein n=1 Tax=Trypanosoma grayi TaxID=71804 RepID=UPI0004F430DD